MAVQLDSGSIDLAVGLGRSEWRDRNKSSAVSRGIQSVLKFGPQRVSLTSPR
jgi:hypothetical protein